MKEVQSLIKLSKIKRFKKKYLPGVTFIELIVSMIILSVVLAGLLHVFVLSKSFIVHSRSRIAAAELGRRFLDPLQDDVRADTWDALSLGNTLAVQATYAGSPISLANVAYTPTYTITNKTVGSSQQIRKVLVNITWNETTWN